MVIRPVLGQTVRVPAEASATVAHLSYFEDLYCILYTMVYNINKCKCFVQVILSDVHFRHNIISMD